jgi:putative addiction module killer protein
MFVIRETERFSRWLENLRDAQARARIVRRVERLANGNLGDAKSVGGSVSELRIDYGPGYRVYFVRRGDLVFLLLCGGDKKSQSRDIMLARKIANDED